MSLKPILTIFSLIQGTHSYCGVTADLRPGPRRISSPATNRIGNHRLNNFVTGDDRLILIMPFDLRVISLTIYSQYATG